MRRRCCPTCAPRGRRSWPISATSARSRPTMTRRWPRSSTASQKPSRDAVAADGHPQGTAEPHPLHPLDAEDHVGAEVVAASRLRRAQEQAEAARPYAQRMERMLGSLAASLRGQVNAAPLLAGTGADQVHLLIVATSDRGLAGGFNASIIRETRRTIRALESQGKTVKLLTLGRKGRDALRRDHGKRIVDSRIEIGRPRLRFEEAQTIAEVLLALYADKQFDVCTIVFNHFRSAIAQIVTKQQLIPFSPPADTAAPADAATRGVYEFVPDEVVI